MRENKGYIIPCQHLIAVLRFCAKIKFCDASIEKRVPEKLKYESLKRGYNGWKKGYTGMVNIFRLESKRVVGQSPRSCTKRTKRYEKKEKARGQKGELEKEARALEQSSLAMKRKEFLDELIEKVKSSRSSKGRLLLN